MKVFIIWLTGVIIWNFGYPTASPLEDVLAAIVLSFVSMYLKKFIAYQRMTYEQAWEFSWVNFIRDNQTIDANNYSSDLFLDNIGAAGSYSIFVSNIDYRYLSGFLRLNYNWNDN